MADPARAAQATLARHDGRHQVVRVQAALHQRAGASLAAEPHGGGRRRMRRLRLDQLAAVEAGLGGGRHGLDRRARPDQDGLHGALLTAPASGPSRLSRSQGQATATVSGGASALRRSSCSRCWWRWRMMSGLRPGLQRDALGRQAHRHAALGDAAALAFEQRARSMALSSVGRAVTVPCTAMRSPGTGSMTKRSSCDRISQPGPGRHGR